MINLDDLSLYEKNTQMKEVVDSISFLPQQIKQSFSQSLKIEYPKDYFQAKNIIIGGMGGSRFPAYIIKELFKDRVKIPVLINDDYHLPSFVNEETLLILSSYSGTTEEVLEMAKEGEKRHALITGSTINDELEKFFLNKKIPYYKISPIYNPSGQPRIGFGYLVGSLLGILLNTGYLNYKKEYVFEAIKRLPILSKNYQFRTKKSSNPAKTMAESLYQRYPYFIVSEFLTGVGNAIANQINETAKSISCFRVIPELNHHLMEGLKFPDKLKEILIFVFFNSNLYNEKNQKRFKITKEVVEKNQIKTLWYELTGKNKIEQVFELMAFGSFLSLYLSILYQQDPKIIPFVDYFKKRLKE